MVIPLLANIVGRAIRAVRLHVLTRTLRDGRPVWTKRRRSGTDPIVAVGGFVLRRLNCGFHMFASVKRWQAWEVTSFNLLHADEGYACGPEGRRGIWMDEIPGKSLRDHAIDGTITLPMFTAAGAELRRVHARCFGHAGELWSHGDPHLGNHIYDSAAGRTRLIDFETQHHLSRPAEWRHADDLLAFILELTSRLPEDQWPAALDAFFVAYDNPAVMAELQRRLAAMRFGEFMLWVARSPPPNASRLRHALVVVKDRIGWHRARYAETCVWTNSTSDTGLGVPSPVPSRHWLRRPGGMDIIHAVLLYAFIGAMKYSADRYAWATLLAYSPRWPWLVPGALSILLAPLFRRLPWFTALVMLIASIWLLDVHAPLPWPAPQTSPRIRIFTLNADGGGTAGRGTDVARIGALIAQTSPDLIFLQEWAQPGPPPLPPGDWQTRRLRGAMIVSRFPIDSVTSMEPSALLNDSMLLGCRITVAPGRQIWAMCPHLETPRRGFTHLLNRRADGWQLLQTITDQRNSVSQRVVDRIHELTNDDDVLIAGDFNLIADGHIFRSHWGRYGDAFGVAGWGDGGTKLQDGWRPRIDHVLTGNKWVATAAWVGPDVGSDHLPLLADVRPR